MIDDTLEPPVYKEIYIATRSQFSPSVILELTPVDVIGIIDTVRYVTTLTIHC